MPERDFCGCCGRETAFSDHWCRDCAAHVEHPNAPHGAEWDRTWFAQTGEECPFQVGEEPPKEMEVAVA